MHVAEEFRHVALDLLRNLHKIPDHAGILPAEGFQQFIRVLIHQTEEGFPVLLVQDGDLQFQFSSGIPFQEIQVQENVHVLQRSSGKAGKKMLIVPVNGVQELDRVFP